MAKPNKETSDQHEDWYNTIRGKTWERIQFEHEVTPSIDALEYHWARTIWVIDYWSQSCSEKITPLPINMFGWQKDDNDIQVMWDSPENIQKVKERVTFLAQGCGCRSGCKNRQCRCVKNKTVCGPTRTCGI